MPHNPIFDHRDFIGFQLALRQTPDDTATVCACTDWLMEHGVPWTDLLLRYVGRWPHEDNSLQMVLATMLECVGEPYRARCVRATRILLESYTAAQRFAHDRVPFMIRGIKRFALCWHHQPATFGQSFEISLDNVRDDQAIRMTDEVMLSRGFNPDVKIRIQIDRPVESFRVYQTLQGHELILPEEKDRQRDDLFNLRQMLNLG